MDKDKIYYYPDNLKASFILKYWSLKDIAIAGGIAVMAMLIFLFYGVWIFFAAPIIYGIVTIKIQKNYNIVKLLLLHIRYFITDKLIIKWR